MASTKSSIIPHPRQKMALSLLFISVVLLLTAGSLSYFRVTITQNETETQTQTHRRLLNIPNIWSAVGDPKSTTSRSTNPLGDSSTLFSFSMFPSINDMFVDQRLIEVTSRHPKDMVVVFVDTTYLETFGVWLDHYKQHDNSGRILCIIAVSEMAYEGCCGLLFSRNV